jgi:hypothetical protein
MSTEIAKKESQALTSAPAFMQKGDRRGLETIGKEDMLVPRLALAQALSPEVTKGDPKQIEGLQSGDLFNSVTKTKYGAGPIYVQIVRKDALRAMEFVPLDDGGGVKDPNVPLNDDRLKWGSNGEKPKATLFRDYLAVILPTAENPNRELIALSFKSSGIKVAKQLNGLIATRNMPIFAGRYSITTKTELKPKPHQVFVIENADWVDELDYRLGEELWAAMKDADVVIDRGHPATDGTAGDEIPF